MRTLNFLFHIVDEFARRVRRFVVRLGEVLENFWYAHRKKLVDLLLSHLDDLIRSVLG